MFFVQKAQFPKNNVPLDAPFDLKDISDTSFFSTVSDDAKATLTSLLQEAQKRHGPVIKVQKRDSESPDHEEICLLVAYRHGTTHSFFSGLTALYHYHGLHSTRKYIERFSNGLCTYSLFLYRKKNLSPDSRNYNVPIETVGRLVAEDASLIYVLPRTSLFDLFVREELSVSQVTYAYALWKFSHQFFSSLMDDDFHNISSQLSSQDQSVLSKLRAGVKRELLTEGRVKEVVYEYGSIIRDLYEDFKAKFIPNGDEYTDSTEEILTRIKRAANSDTDLRILTCMVQFNRHILKTNFFKKSKVALSFRLDPAFLSRVDFPTTPYAIFFIVGAEFRGFHVRFMDISRGGVRAIRSMNAAAFSMNVSTLFDENYNLSLTQQRKNKDIPEGGSKGTILLSLKHQDKALVAFQKYIDSLLDLLLITDEIRDYYGKEELLFLGPDEGTADFMNWASLHARERGYKFWKSFTTGKSRSLGGIPHDYYGMTTRSIHQYVLGILEKKGLDETKIRKFQTGGPDGDLGSNNIKISKDKTVGIVDGSGVLFDPQGIDRAELLRLANARKMTDHFDVSKLSPEGFYVSVNDTDKVLPGGKVVDSGLMFRNTFHLLGEYLFGVDLFVPCGGRPAAVNANNVQCLWDAANKQPMFKYIVEGANLFFSQEARLQLEKWGVVLFKDSSVNKGGVTSSSLEVLAALALTDEEFEVHMQVKDIEKVPAFYEEYVSDVQRIIEARAREEFECLWREHEKTGTPFSLLSDQLSEKINKLHIAIFASSLWQNEALREKIIADTIPQNLIKLVGKENVMSRVPESYLKALFSATLACQFVYAHGLDAGEFGFFEFMQALTSPQ